VTRDLRRRVLSAIFSGLCAAAVILALLPLAFILLYLLRQGLGALHWTFFVQNPKPVGEPGGGFANAIVGTLILIALAALMAVPIGIAAGIYTSEYRGSRLATTLRFAADVLNGVPSIVIGIFAYSVVVLPVRRFSALAGGFALGVMMIPIIARTTEELLKLVPDSLRDGALALGSTRAKAMFTVILPAALPGILTGILLAVARVAGETAPLLFTAFGNRFLSTRLDQPIASLTVQIYTYAVSPYEDWHRQAWAGAFLLVMVVLTLSIVARTATRRLERMHG
jgi:phosphate transport system permease protein